MHRLSDLQAGGAAGSHERALVEGLLADAETRVIYRQATDQLHWTCDTLRLTGTETELLVEPLINASGKAAAFVRVPATGGRPS